MPAKVRLGGAWVNIVAILVFSGGAWRDALALRGRSGSLWRLVLVHTGTVSLSISPSPFLFSQRTTNVDGDLTATPSGGLAPYSYVWSVISGDDLDITDGATSATATVVAKHVSVPSPRSATFRCVATDSLGSTAAANVSGTFTTS